MAGYFGSKRSSSLVSATEITLDGAKLKSSGDSITKSDGTTAVLSESSGTVTFTTNNAVIEGSSSGDLVRITQTGSGNALVVEDSTNPDSSPFVVNANGNVLSGNTTSATYPDYYGSARAATVQVTTDNSDSGSSVSLTSFRSNSTGQTYLSFNKAYGTKATPTAVVNNSIIGSQLFNGYDGTAFIAAANIIAAVDGTPGTNDMPGRLIFSTTADSASSPTERMRIDSSGNVGIGTSLPGAKLEVNGDIIADGVYLGGTGAANYLDDYEEGTWTPSIIGATVSGGSVSGSYTKVGRSISLTAQFTGVTISSVSGYSYITGFPFSSTATSVGNMAHCTMTSAGQAYLGIGTSALLTPLNTTGVTAAWNAGSNKYMTFQITYHAS